ncbi:unnamed protein product [Soboliphyme baturini]|uniref:Tetraspanin n=1 Tax=Soboliphyme baturini TaxID=241478 RepID=A0A183ITE9_9BILA|nr:unnamed protein product [Soboliphyme baturini]
MCSGFTCSKNALIALNTLFLASAIVLIVVGTYAKAVSIVPSITVPAGIVSVGVFLLFLSILGYVGAVKHHQVCLFFVSGDSRSDGTQQPLVFIHLFQYMIILFLIFIVQFFVAVACLAISDAQIHSALQVGWKQSSNETRCSAEKHFACCGLDDKSQMIECDDVMFRCTYDVPCWPIMGSRLSDALQIAGGIGLFFSFTEVLKFRRFCYPVKTIYPKNDIASKILR